MKKIKVLVAMSGGVDSSVAALLMKEKGYDVIGAFMKNWSNSKNKFGECTWKDDRRFAIKIASQLQIPLITLDFEKEYQKEVVDVMFDLYRKGITPNPDVDCNQKIKFPLLWKAAEKLGANFIVTGHYARIKKVVNNKSNFKLNNKISSSYINNKYQSANKSEQHYRYELLRSKDESKDQSYFLYRLNQKDLSHSLFPIGEYTKKQIREIAKKNGFENFNRKSTVGICFIGKIKLKKFLQKKIKPKKGKILNPEGKIIGEHDGIYYYTIGQRIGSRFGIEIKKESEKGQVRRWYVAKKNLKRNEIIAAPEGHSLNFRKEIILKNEHWINKKPINIKNKIVNIKTSRVDSTIKSASYGWVDGNNSIKVLSRIRQVGELLPCTLKYSNNKYTIILNKSITGVSEGQAIVFYQKDKCLGGGVISFE